MGCNLNIRNANEGDLPFILACEANPENTYVHSWDKNTHARNLITPAFHYLIAENEQSAPVAYAILRDDGTDKTEWRRIIVAQPGNGVGKAFMQGVISMFFENKTKAIWLDVYEENKRARHVYKSLGFTETSIQPLPENPEKNLVFMELKRSV
ncbi:MAG: GNAT family N-acetyltransferase [Kordiimonas sp.]